MTLDAAHVAELAREAFFAKVFEFMPSGTTGDFPPDADIAFEKASKDAVETIMRNRPQQSYYVMYRVQWIPEHPGDTDGPMDVTHDFACSDSRVTDFELAAIGDMTEVIDGLRRNRGRT